MISLTIWEDKGLVDNLEGSPSYRRTVRDLSESGLLIGGPSVETFEGGAVRSEPLAGSLDRMDQDPPPTDAAT